MSFDICQPNLTEGFCMGSLLVKFIPWPLTAQLKEHCMSVAPDLLKCAKAEFF
jgi:hypothetical protein